MSTTYILFFSIFCAGSVGLGNLYLYMLQPGQLFDFVQPTLVALNANIGASKKIEFIYKSIGGCEVCTRQRFTDIVYIILCFLFPLKWYLLIAFYPVFGGLAFYFDSLAGKRNQSVNPQTKTKKIEL